MKTLIYDRNKIKNYKEFYEKLYVDLDGKGMIDWGKFEYLGYSTDRLNEFLWYCSEDSNTYIFKNFDLEKIKQDTKYEDHKWKLIFEVFQDMVAEYPNNKLEFVNDAEEEKR